MELGVFFGILVIGGRKQTSKRRLIAGPEKLTELRRKAREQLAFLIGKIQGEGASPISAYTSAHEFTL